MIASMRLLGSGIARRAWLRVQFQVVFRCFLLSCQLELGAWKANEVFAVPACFADFAKSKVAVLTDCEAFSRWRQFLRGGITVIGLRLLCLLCLLYFFLSIALAIASTGWSLTPLTRAVDRRSIRFEVFLPLQFDVALDGVLL